MKANDPAYISSATHSGGAMIEMEEALRRLDESLAGNLLPSESSPVREARGRILAEEAVSQVELPPFDKSAMDGYALMAGDEREEYRLLETVAAGHAGSCALEPGAAVKVMTGAPVPSGTGRVMMVEHAEERDGVVIVNKRSTAPNICRRAEDMQRGQQVLPAGARLGALEIANLVACGITEISVRQRPRLAIVSTGDELANDPAELADGKIMNANGPLLSGLAVEHGLVVVSEETVPDEPSATREAVKNALANSDIVTFSGGVSVGDFDYVLGALAEADVKVHFSRIAVKPGKPTVFASAGAQAIFGLPGNPVSAFMMFHLFVLRTVARLTGAVPIGPPLADASPTGGLSRLMAPLAVAFERRRIERREFVPAAVNERGELAPVKYHGSANLTALHEADGFFAIERGVKRLAAGERVVLWPMIKHGA